MSQFGKYKPDIAENSSALFVFQEKPVASLKLNRWNGNISAGFDLLHKFASIIVSQDQPAIITSETNQALKVIPTDPPSMQVLVIPGWAVFNSTLAGIEEQNTLPFATIFTPPLNEDRIDLVYLSQYGELMTLMGEEATPPQAPDLPANAIVLAQILHRPGSTQILTDDNSVDSYIIDQRPKLILAEAHKHNPDHSPIETPDGVRTEFTTKYHFRAGTLDVFLNGVLQQENIDFTVNQNLNGYTFLNPPLSHYKIQHRYIINHQSED